MDRIRTTERRWDRILLAAAFAVVGVAWLLCLLAKVPDLKTAGRTQLNRVSRDRLAVQLRIDTELAGRLLAGPQGRRRFADVDSLGAVRLLSPAEIATISAKLRGTRSPAAHDVLRAAAGLPAPVRRRLEAALVAGEVSPERWPAARVLSRADFKLHAPLLIARTGGEFARGALFSLVLWMAAGLLAWWLAARLGLPSARILLPLALLLTGIGTVILMSIKHPLQDGLAYRHHLTGTFIGMLVMLVAARLPYDALRRWRYLYALAAVGLMVALLCWGGGPARVVRLSLLGVQPVEIVKLLLVLFTASYLAGRGQMIVHRVEKRFGLLLPSLHDIGPLLVGFAFALFVLFIARDLGPAIVLFSTFLIMLVVATGRPLYLGLGAVLLVGAGALGYAADIGVLRTRVDMWLHPWDNGHAGGDHLAQAWWGITSGGAGGSGIGLGSPSFISRAGSDMLLASLGEEWGIAGLALVAVAFAILLHRALAICRKAGGDNTFALLLGTGLVSLLAVSMLVIAGGVAGLIPLTGIALPFASYGNSAQVTAFLALGVLLGLERGHADGDALPRHLGVRLRRLALALLIAILVVFGRLCLLPLTGGDEMAARAGYTVDADGVKRPKRNPRLLVLAKSIPRGRILDRRGRVVAEPSHSGTPADDARQYPYGSALAHLVGFTNPAYGGPTGMEARFETTLRGFEDYRALVPAMRRRHLSRKPPFTPRDVTLTVDAELQRDIATVLRRHAGRLADARTGKRKEKAAAVLLDVKSGEVLAAVSVPAYNPNTLTPDTWSALIADGESRQALLDRARNGSYPPGSTFKIVTAAAALEQEIDLSITCAHRSPALSWTAGGRAYGPRIINDVESARAHGRIGLHDAIARSCNVYFARLGIEVGATRLREAIAAIALRTPPTLEDVGKALPDTAIGQGALLLSPLEMARATAAVANGGVIVLPTIIGGDGADSVEISEGTGAPRLLSPAHAATLRAAMRDVCRTGTARGVFTGLPFAVAGKTGTAENAQGDGRPHAWFIGFAPAERPRVAFAVVIENGGAGGSVAAPAARDILQAWWQRRTAE